MMVQKLRKVFFILCLAVFAIGMVSFTSAQSTGDVDTGTGDVDTGTGDVDTGTGDVDTGTGDVDTGTGDVDDDTDTDAETCSMMRPHVYLVEKFSRKLTRFHTRWPEKGEQWQERFEHLLDVLPEGSSVWCMTEALYSHLLDLLLEETPTDEDTDSAEQRGWSKRGVYGTWGGQQVDEKESRWKEKKEKNNNRRQNR